MRKNAVRWLSAPILFALGVTIYALVLHAPVNLTVLLVIAAIVLLGNTISARLLSKRTTL